MSFDTSGSRSDRCFWYVSYYSGKRLFLIAIHCANSEKGVQNDGKIKIEKLINVNLQQTTA